jgi:DNA-binding NarL/FixJ family response regulator
MMNDHRIRPLGGAHEHPVDARRSHRSHSEVSTLQRRKRIHVLIADDHPGIRVGLCELLSCLDDIEVIGSVVNGKDAVALAAMLVPDVILIDVGMPVMDGIEATRCILATNPDLRVVTLTASRDRRDEAFQAGAAAHVMKDATPAELIGCIRAVATGETQCPHRYV